jgi:hypothetical protein
MPAQVDGLSSGPNAKVFWSFRAIASLHEYPEKTDWLEQRRRRGKSPWGRFSCVPRAPIMFAEPKLGFPSRFVELTRS